MVFEVHLRMGDLEPILGPFDKHCHLVGSMVINKRVEHWLAILDANHPK